MKYEEFERFMTKMVCNPKIKRQMTTGVIFFLKTPKMSIAANKAKTV